MDILNGLELLDNTNYIFFRPDTEYIKNNKHKYIECLKFINNTHNNSYSNLTCKFSKYSIIISKSEIQILFHSKNKFYNYLKNYIETSAENKYKKYSVKYYVRKYEFHMYKYTPYISIYID